MSVNLKIGFKNNFITNSSYTKFLWVTMDNILSWNNHIDLLMKKIQYGLSYDLKCQNMHVCLFIKNDLLCFLSLGYELWNYILGKLIT